MNNLDSKLGKDDYDKYEAQIIDLFRSLNSLFPKLENKVFLFVSTNQKEGTTTVVNGLARVAAKSLGKSVLILDIGSRNTPTSTESEIKSPKDGELGSENRQAFSEHNLIEYHSNTAGSIKYLNAQNLDLSRQELVDKLIAESRAKYNLVLVDCAAISLSDNFLAVGPLTDGVIINLEADKTRSPVAESAVERLVNSGAHVIGAVLNKRRYYIPQTLYNML